MVTASTASTAVVPQRPHPPSEARLRVEVTASGRIVKELETREDVQGNSVQLTWRARLDDHLGTYTVELLEARAAGLIASRTRLYACQLLCDHLRLLPERDPHDRLLAFVLHALALEAPAELGEAVARFELMLLEELGFGLDLSRCAATVSGTVVQRAAARASDARHVRIER